MTITAIIDTSIFIWDKGHYDANKNNYHDLMVSIPMILQKITIDRIPVLFRGELLSQIQGYFPYDLIPNKYYDTFQRLTLSYLTKINMIDYLNCDNYNLSCNPNLVRDYFANSTKEEIEHLLNHAYKVSKANFKILTFHVIWQSETISVNISNGHIKAIPLRLCDDALQHDSIILSLKKVFEHNPKHTKVIRLFRGKIISPFRYYDSRKNDDKAKAQSLLDRAIFVKNSYYSWDKNDNVFVRFLNTESNLYHGFEIDPSNELKTIIEMNIQS